MPFRETHHIVGSLVGKLTRSGRDMTDFQVRSTAYAIQSSCVGLNIPLLSTKIVLQAVLEHLRESGIPVDGKEAEDLVFKSIDPEQIMLSYESEGGTGPRAVAGIIAELEEELAM